MSFADNMQAFVNRLNADGMKLALPAAMAWANLEQGQVETWPENNNPFNVLFIGTLDMYNKVKGNMRAFAKSTWGPVNNVGSVVSYPTIEDGADAVFAVWEYHNFAPFLASLNATEDATEQIKVIASSPWGPYSPGQEGELVQLVAKFIPAVESEAAVNSATVIDKLESFKPEEAEQVLSDLAEAWNQETNPSFRKLCTDMAFAVRLFMVANGWGTLEYNTVSDTFMLKLADGREI
jgi:hypothetical protein